MAGFLNPGVFEAAWSPIELIGVSLHAWYDAADLATITESGGAVSQWNDKSGNGYHLTQSTGASRPTTGAQSLNSRNVLAFDGGDFLQASTAADWTLFHNGTPVYIGIVVMPSSGSSNPGTRQGILTTRGTFSQRGLYLAYDDVVSNNGILFYVRDSGSDAIAHEPGANTLTPQTWHVMSLRFDSNASPNSARSLINVDRGGNLGSNGAGGGSSSTAPTETLEVGSNHEFTNGLTGRVAEIVITTAHADKTLVEDYFLAKWGV